MGLLFRVISATHCRGTHHKLALEALDRLQCAESDRWRDLFLKHHEAYLLGAKAPDTRFQDFYNHVLYVEQEDWGGAPEAARLWFERALETLKKRHWVNGIYAAGALSHYYTDPIHPFHTGQSEAANTIHQALEWNINHSYDELWELAEQIGLPAVSAPAGEMWLEEMVKRGAEFSRPHYQTLIDHYDFERGRDDPSAGLDEVGRDVIAKLLGFAVAGWSRILDRLLTETQLEPPRVRLSIPTVLAALEIPLHSMANKLRGSADHAHIKAMYAELQNVGKVEEHLPEENRAVRDLFYEDWPESAPQKPPSHEEPGQSFPAEQATQALDEMTFHLQLSDPVENAPSIGRKTARRLQRMKIHSVEDFLNAEPEEAAERLRARHMTPDRIRDWQDQARLVCCVPKLNERDAQILVACGYRDPLDISTAPTEELQKAAVAFSESPEGRQLIRSGNAPDEGEIIDWQSWAGQARELKAA